MSRTIVKRSGIEREEGFIYFINDDGNVASIKEVSNPGKQLKINIVSKTRINKKPGYAYFIDENGDVCKVKLSKVVLKEKVVKKVKKQK